MALEGVLVTLNDEEEQLKANVIEFLTTIMEGSTPIKDVDQLHPDDTYFCFKDGVIKPKLMVPKTGDRIKAAENLMKIYDMTKEVIESNVVISKDAHFIEHETFFDKIRPNK